MWGPTDDEWRFIRNMIFVAAFLVVAAAFAIGAWVF